MRCVKTGAILVVMLALSVVFAPSAAFAEEDGSHLQAADALEAQSIATGTWGECAWELDANGTLTVHPGNTDESTWYGEWFGSEVITHVVFEKGENGEMVIGHDCRGLFSGCENLTSVDFSGFDASFVTNSVQMFYECTSLKTLDLSGLDFSNASEIWEMFYGCSSLEAINFTGFKTAAETSLLGMFEGCESLKALDLSGFATSNVTDARSMFRGCETLKSINLSSFDTSKLKYSKREGEEYYMFEGCRSLEKVVLGENVTKLDEMPGTWVVEPDTWINGRSDWFSIGADRWLTSSEIAQNRLGIADTYTKVDPSPTVTFDSDGGSAVASQTLTGGSKATKPADPSKADYVFAGWTLDGEAYDFNKPVTYDITLKATWRGAKRTVSFDSAGGSPVAAGETVYGETVAWPSEPTRTDYVFAGWTLNGEAYDFSKPVTSDITLVATWQPVTYTVAFDSAAGTAVASQTVEIHKAAMRPADPAREGFEFAGWLLDGALYDFSTPVTSHLTLVAAWKEAKYTVSFDSSEGSSVPSQIVVGGTTAVKPISPTRDGYAFTGWLRDGEPYDFSSPVTSDVSLIASWEKADVSYTADSDWAAGAVGAVDGGADLAFQNESLAQDGASDVARQAWGRMSSHGAATIICVDVKLFVVGVDGRRLSELTDGLSIKVTLAVDPQYNGRKVKVTQVHEGQAIDHPEADRVRDGAVRLNVTQLSEFVIAVDDGPQEMHRLYNQWSGEHFYTADDEEFAGLVELGWTDEGTGWTAPAASDTPVFRLYNPYAGEHHYTMDAAERDAMVEAGWQYEDVGWYSDDAKTVPLYREYNPYMFANNHNYTTNREEHDGLVSLGWLDEGYAWYGV